MKVRKKSPNSVIPSEARNPSLFLHLHPERFLASLGMTKRDSVAGGQSFDFCFVRIQHAQCLVLWIRRSRRVPDRILARHFDLRHIGSLHGGIVGEISGSWFKFDQPATLS